MEQEEARQTKQKLAPVQGAVLTTVESRHILMLYATPVLPGLPSPVATENACDVFSVGTNKVHSIIKMWRETDELKQGSSDGRGVAKDPDNDGRHKLSTAMPVNLREYTNCAHNRPHSRNHPPPSLCPPASQSVLTAVLRGTVVNRTYGIHKHLYI